MDELARVICTHGHPDHAGGARELALAGVAVLIHPADAARLSTTWRDALRHPSRGGIFAALYGTVGVLEPADRALVAGFVINKFRGDPGLLRPGLADLERLTGRRVYGTLPWDPGLWLDSEDALDCGDDLFE